MWGTSVPAMAPCLPGFLRLGFCAVCPKVESFYIAKNEKGPPTRRCLLIDGLIELDPNMRFITF